MWGDDFVCAAGRTHSLSQSALVLPQLTGQELVLLLSDLCQLLPRLLQLSLLPQHLLLSRDDLRRTGTADNMKMCLLLLKISFLYNLRLRRSIHWAHTLNSKMERMDTSCSLTCFSQRQRQQLEIHFNCCFYWKWYTHKANQSHPSTLFGGACLHQYRTELKMNQYRRILSVLLHVRGSI